MTLFVDTGSVVYQTPSDIPTITTIPAGTYTLGFDPENVPGGFFLKRINNFTLPAKIYGSNNKYSDIILNNFLKETTRPTTAALAGLKGSGKAQPLDAKVLTPNGFVTMGSLKVGDTITDHLGRDSKILGVFPQGIKDIYKITFQDGRSTECCEDHLWNITKAQWRVKKVNGKQVKQTSKNVFRTVDTKEIIRSLDLTTSGKNKAGIHIPVFTPNVNTQNIEVPVRPYLLGALIGDGGLTNTTISFTTADVFIANKMSTLVKEYDCVLNKLSNKYAYSIVSNTQKNNLKKLLSDLNIDGKYSHEKEIPVEYLNLSYNQTIELLQGLFDTDGTIDSQSSVSFCTTSEVLAKQVQYLVRSIGGICKIGTKIPTFTHKDEKCVGRLAYILSVRHATPSIFFSLPRHLERCNDNHQYSANFKLRIKSVEYVGTKEAQCISIDSPEKLYVTDDYIVTHNTLCTKEICIKALERDIPTIVIGQDYAGPSLNTWLQNIDQPCVIFIDEFEKVYADQKKRDQLLTLLDGAYNSHKLFLLTMNAALNNEKFPYFFNRPGRVYYNIAFEPITQEVIKEYCEDHLIDKTKVSEILSFTNRFSAFTIDILTILVKELNSNPTFKCQDVTDIVNIKPDVKPDQLLFKTEAFSFNPENLQASLSPLIIAFNRSENATKNTIVLDFSFSRNFLSGERATFYLPIFTLDQYEQLRQTYENVNGYPVMSFSVYVDPTDFDMKDEEDQKDFQSQVKKYKNKPIGWVYYNVCLKEGNTCTAYTEHSQNPETRMVTIKHPLSGTIITLSIDSRVEKPLAYTF